MSVNVCMSTWDMAFKLTSSLGQSSRLPNQILAVFANLMVRELNLKIARVGVIQQKRRLVFLRLILET